MADSTIDSELIFMYDVWPGAAQRSPVAPTGGFTGSTHHNVATAGYSIGEKVWVYNDSAGVNGWSCFVYLAVGTQNASSVLAVKVPAVPDSATNYYKLTNDPDDCVKLPTKLGCFALSAMTDAYYGWFWCGGVVPEEYVSGLGGNFATNGSLAAGDWLFHNLSDDTVGIDACSAVNEPPAGFALAADA